MSQLTRKLIIIGTHTHTHNRSLSLILCVICSSCGCSFCYIHNTLLLRWFLFCFQLVSWYFLVSIVVFAAAAIHFVVLLHFSLSPPPLLFLSAFFYCKNPFRNFENFITTFKHEQIFSTNHKFFINLKAHPIWIFPPISLHFRLSSFFLFLRAHCSHSFGSNSWKIHWSIEKKIVRSLRNIGIKSTAMCVFVRHLSTKSTKNLSNFFPPSRNAIMNEQKTSLCVARWQRINIKKVYRERFDIGDQMKN